MKLSCLAADVTPQGIYQKLPLHGAQVLGRQAEREAAGIERFAPPHLADERYEARLPEPLEELAVRRVQLDVHGDAAHRSAGGLSRLSAALRARLSRHAAPDQRLGQPHDDVRAAAGARRGVAAAAGNPGAISSSSRPRSAGPNR